MKRLLCTLALAFVMGGCGGQEDPEPQITKDAEENAASQVAAHPSETPAAATPTPEHVPDSPAPEEAIVTLTERAAAALRRMAEQYSLGKDYYVRIIVQRRGPGDYAFDLNITRQVDPAVDLIVPSQGIRIVVNRTSVPYIHGGIVDFESGGRGFQFRKPADLVEPPPPEIALTPTTPSPAPSTEFAKPRTGISSGPYSNIHQADYVGPQACANCHTEQFELWRTHPHSRMNRNADAQSVRGDFSGVHLDYAGRRAVFDEQDGQYRMTIYESGDLMRRYRVTRSVGSRIFQMYIGVQSEGPEPPGDSLYRDERKLPLAYWLDRAQWFPESYDEPTSPAEYDQSGEVTQSYAIHTRNFRTCWDENCLWCHNTYPYEARLQYNATGFPHDDLSLSAVRNAVPAGRSPGMRSFPPEELVTLGVSCESCHFGGREHVVEEREIRFLPCSDDLQFPRATVELMAGARKSPYVINSICSQCHAVRQPKYPSSASTWNSAEAADLLSGACATAIKCTDCHEPHTPGPPAGGGQDNPRHVEACVRCHEPYRDAEAAAAHSRHSAESGVNCLDCHMPRIVHGLQTVVRSHHISSPSDVRMLSRGAPNACNMCHLDRSVQWTLDELSRGWECEIEATDDWKKWYGGTLDEPVGRVWLRHPAPMARQVSADSFSRSPLGPSALADIVPLLNDADPPTRMFALFALERILGRQLPLEEYSPWAAPDVRAEQVKALLP